MGFIFSTFFNPKRFLLAKFYRQNRVKTNYFFDKDAVICDVTAFLTFFED
jgi:hypothetical protein